MAKIDSSKVSKELKNNTEGHFKSVKDILLALGEVVTWDPNTVTVAEVQDSIALIIGKKIKDELTNDPKGRGYAGKTDAQTADLFNAGYDNFKKDLAGVTFEVIAPLDTQTIKLRRVGGAAAGFNGFGTRAFQNKLMVFTAGTATAALRGIQRFVVSHDDDTIFLAGRNGVALPVAPIAGDQVQLLESSQQVFSPRVSEVLVGIPFAPNIIDNADVKEAKK
jgi:hypothetical protein